MKGLIFILLFCLSLGATEAKVLYSLLSKCDVPELKVCDFSEDAGEYLDAYVMYKNTCDRGNGFACKKLVVLEKNFPIYKQI